MEAERPPNPQGEKADSLIAPDSSGNEDRRSQRSERMEARLARAERRALIAQNEDSDPTALRVRRVVQRLTVAPPPREALVGYETRFALPLPRKRKSYAAHVSFLFFFVLPVVIGSIYYLYLASPQYVAEFRFSVQDTTPTAAATSSVSSLLSAVGAGSTSANTNYLVTDFLASREAIDELQKRINIIQLYSKPGVDWWSRFNPSKPIETAASPGTCPRATASPSPAPSCWTASRP